MGKLGNISGREAAGAFEKAGWQPKQKELGSGLLRKLLMQADLSTEEFNRL